MLISTRAPGGARGRRAGPRAGGPTLAELLIAAVVLAVLAVLVYGPHVENGGFAWDDWENAATTAYDYQRGFLGPFDLRPTIYQPVLQLLLPIPHLLFGADPGPHLALAVALSVAASLAFFGLLRTLGLELPHALAIAALALIFPWSDSGRLWATAGLNHVPIILYFVGLTLAVQALRSRGPRAVTLERVSIALYAASVLTYSLAAVACLASVVVYVAVAGWPEARRRWRWDVLVVVVLALYVSLATTKPTTPPSGYLDHAVAIAREGVVLLARAVEPWGAPSAELVWLGILGAVALIAIVGVATRADLARQDELRRWTLVACAGLIGILASWAIYIPGEAKYRPLAAGIYNRVNLLAAFAIAALLYALLMLLATALVGARGRRRWVATGLAIVAAAALIGAGWIDRLEREKQRWADADALQEQVLAAVAQVRDAPDGTNVFTFGRPGERPRGVPVFGQSWDLDAAVKLRFARPGLDAYPVVANTRLICGRAAVRMGGTGFGQTAPSAYGQTIFLDVDTRRATPIRSQAACVRVARRLGATAIRTPSRRLGEITRPGDG